MTSRLTMKALQEHFRAGGRLAKIREYEGKETRFRFADPVSGQEATTVAAKAICSSPLTTPVLFDLTGEAYEWELSPDAPAPKVKRRAAR